MYLSAIILLTTVANVVSAHFRLLYPEPRGVFVADQEPNFCGGYSNAVNNRSTFPLRNGFFSIRSGHPSWSAAVMISTVQNPTSFDNFSSDGRPQYVKDFARESNAGTFCIPLNLSSTGMVGVRDGANVTVQIVFAGGDGNLYQCADLTLSNSFPISSNVSCTNETATSTASHTATGASSSQTAGTLGRREMIAGYTAGALGITSFVFAFL